jgi:hypothetical protein
MAILSPTGLQHDALRASSLLMVDGLRPRQRATARWLQPSARITISVARSSPSNARSWFPPQHPARKVLHLVIEPAPLFISRMVAYNKFCEHSIDVLIRRTDFLVLTIRTGGDYGADAPD